MSRLRFLICVSISERVQTGGAAEHKELADRSTGMHHLERQVRLGSEVDGNMSLSHTCNAPAFTSEKNLRGDMKFVKWFVQKNRGL